MRQARIHTEGVCDAEWSEKLRSRGSWGITGTCCVRVKDLRRRSSGPSCWSALLCSRRSRCRSDGSSGGRCNPYGTWSKRYSCGTWTAAPAGWPGWRRGVCTCACTNGFETVAPHRTTCRLRNRRFEWGIPAACKTTFIWFFLSLSRSFLFNRPLSHSLSLSFSLSLAPWYSVSRRVQLYTPFANLFTPFLTVFESMTREAIAIGNSNFGRALPWYREFAPISRRTDSQTISGERERTRFSVSAVSTGRTAHTDRKGTHPEDTPLGTWKTNPPARNYDGESIRYSGSTDSSRGANG